MKKFAVRVCFAVILIGMLHLSYTAVFADAVKTEIYSIDFENGQIPKRLGFVTEDGEKENAATVETVDGNNVLKLDVTKEITAKLSLDGITGSSDIELKPQSGVYEFEYKIKYFKTGKNKYPFFASVAESSNRDLYMNIIREWPSMASTLTYSTSLDYTSDYKTAETNLKIQEAWYTVRVGIDTVNNSAKYFIDNTYIGEQKNLTFDDISYKDGVQCFKFIFRPGDSGEATLYLDNIKIKKYEAFNGLSASNLKIYANDGDILEQITDVEPGDILTAKASVVNTKKSTEPVNLIIALYNNGILSDVESKTVMPDEVLNDESVSITVNDTDNLGVKAFVWSSGITPLVRSVSCTEPSDDAIYKEIMDFETEEQDDGFDDIYQFCQRALGENRTKGVFKFSANKRKESYATKNLSKTVNDGVFCLSFEYKASDYINKFWIRTMGSGSSAQLFYDGGTISYFPDVTSWTRADSGVEYTPGKWCRVKIFIDFDGRTVYYYLNDVLYGTGMLSKNVTDIKSVQFKNEGSYGDICLDNIEFAQIEKISGSLPSEVKENALVTVRTDATGRIFFDKTGISVKAEVKNKTDATQSYTLRYCVSKSDTTVFENETAVKAYAKGRKTVNIPVQTDGYGYYTLRTYLYDSSGNLITRGKDYIFSVANVPEDGLKSEKLGIQITTSNELNQNDRNIDLALMKKLGFTLTRGNGISFGAVDENGNLSVDKWTRSWLENCRDSGVEIVNILSYGNSKITSENPPRSDAALKAFAKYAVDYCTAYKEIYGHAPLYVDVWNEYWMEGSSFNADRATPKDYVNMLKYVSEALSAAYPETEIWGMSGVGFGNIEWTRNVLEAGGGKYIDAFTLHPYSNKQSPTAADKVDAVNQYKALFEEYGFGEKRVYASEWGWPSVGINDYPDEEHQAAYFVCANVLNDANKLFDKIIWYGSNDVGNSNTQEQRFGLIRGAYAEIAYEAKPVYLAAANWQSMMIGAKFEETVRSSDGIYAYSYTLRDGQSAIVAWSENGNKALNLSLDTDSVTVIDMYGNEKTVKGSSNAYTFSIGEMPCYIKGVF